MNTLYSLPKYFKQQVRCKIIIFFLLSSLFSSSSIIIILFTLILLLSVWNKKVHTKPPQIQQYTQHVPQKHGPVLATSREQKAVISCKAAAGYSRSMPTIPF